MNGEKEIKIMDQKENRHTLRFWHSVRRAKETAQHKRKKLAEKAAEQAEEAEVKRVREYQRRQAKLLGEKFDED
jgi:ABC-type Zn2+ transport system substrate-binding protein/surface adhesin